MNTMNRVVIPPPDYTSERNPIEYSDQLPFEPPPDYDPPRMRKVEILEFAPSSRPRTEQNQYDATSPFHNQPKKTRYRNEDRVYGDYDGPYRTLDNRKAAAASSSLGGRYQSQHTRYPSQPPPRQRRSEYQQDRGVFERSNFDSLRERNNENAYGSVISRASSRWCQDCPYCQKMEELEAERTRRARLDSEPRWGSQDRDFPESFREESVVVQEPSYGVIHKTRPLTNLDNTNSVRAAKVYKADKMDQLDVKQGELLQVLKKKPGWWKCRNVYGDKGWIPAQHLFLVPNQ